MTANEFKEHRLELKLTQLQAAQLMGVCKSTINKYETSKVPVSKPMGILMGMLIYTLKIKEKSNEI